jgi:biopolymer transport protein ExbB
MQQFSLTEMWASMGAPARTVALVLIVMGLASLTVFIERLLALRRSRASARTFAAEVGDDLAAGQLTSVIAASAKHRHGHLPRLVHSGLTTYVESRAAYDGGPLSPVERTRRHLERRFEELGADMRRGMTVLATVGSTAPFVGLLGTVLGIITAFHGIASTGSGGLSSVSAGIAEALIETALGLAVAIPAVLAFNFLSTRIARDELALQTSAGELLDTVESWGEMDGDDLQRARAANRVA